jgi:hypothetical protein
MKVLLQRHRSKATELQNDLQTFLGGVRHLSEVVLFPSTTRDIHPQGVTYSPATQAAGRQRL